MHPIDAEAGAMSSFSKKIYFNLNPTPTSIVVKFHDQDEI
jgi:hypothetical protein